MEFDFRPVVLLAYIGIFVVFCAGGMLVGGLGVALFKIAQHFFLG